ncbi:hypothetical protein RchiOBHm_Chr4g0440081 [Rosa chinensis]|uniref:Uncharacterized protein n=1 Tax=Rosa chinensis TaxID=74649 RepID=A0A2P6R306_ROSCH|nr:uncharacterized protein LOC112199868 [Rosa chinensis]PRQ40811.1 hypothetical protein RchiOBHm_Chr4g0440081 [Rosa chinensis]
MAMVETQSSKRQRDDEQETQMLEDPKRQKSYNHILSLLDEDEEEPTQDLNSLITTFQQELSSDSDLVLNPDHVGHQTIADALDASEGYNSSSSGSSSPSSSSALFLKEGDEQEDESSVERVMRRLLEASDDELGIPNRDAGNGFEDAEEAVFNFGDNGLSLCDGLWELEDEAANYYALVQSELFM